MANQIYHNADQSRIMNQGLIKTDLSYSILTYCRSGVHYRAVAYLQLGRMSSELACMRTAQLAWAAGQCTCTHTHISICASRAAHASAGHWPAAHAALSPLPPQPDYQATKVGDSCCRLQALPRSEGSPQESWPK